MADKRSVDDLSIDELERILAIKRRQQRQMRLRRLKQSGRVIDTGTPADNHFVDAPDYANGNGSENGAAASASPNGHDASGLPAQTIEAQPGSVHKRKSVPQFEDAINASTYKNTKKRGDARRIWQTFINRSMLLVEIAAVIGLIALGVSLFEGIGKLQQETAAAQAAAEEQRRAALPTIEPTPQLRLANVVLPSGHTPPEAGRSQFNFAEVPESLHSQIANEIYLPVDISRPEPTDNTPQRIIIPQINVDHTIVQGVDWEALKLGVGQLPNGATPRARADNIVLAAHNDIYGEIFRHLDQLEPGMQFQVQTRTNTYTYVISNIRQVEPDAVEVMEAQGRPMVTLISCYPYQVNNKRIIVTADRVDI